MKLGEIPKSFLFKSNDEMSDLAYFQARVYSGDVELDKKQVISYMTGVDTKTAADNLMDEHLKPVFEKRKQVIGGAVSAQSYYDAIISKPELLLMLKTLNDDPDAIKEFAKNNRMLIDLPRETIMPEEIYRLSGELGVNPMDMFLIDGKTPEEMWGTQYADVTDPTEKDYIYKTLIMKATVSGQHEIAFRTAELDDSYKYISNGSLVAAFKREDGIKITQDFDVLNSIIDDVKVKAVDFKIRLQNTQADKNNNFRINMSEGSEPYQKMCKSLSSLLYIINRKNSDDFTIDEFRRRLAKFQKAAAEYSKRGKTSNQIRLDVAGEASKDMDAYLKTVNETFEKIDKNFAVDAEGTKLSKASFNRIEAQVGKIRENLKKIENFNDLTSQEIIDRRNEIFSKKTEEHNYEEKLREIAGKLPDTKKKMSVEEVAKLRGKTVEEILG